MTSHLTFYFIDIWTPTSDVIKSELCQNVTFDSNLAAIYLKEDLNAVDEEEDDDDEHQDGVAPVEDVGVELAVLVLDPDLKNKLIR